MQQVFDLGPAATNALIDVPSAPSSSTSSTSTSSNGAPSGTATGAVADGDVWSSGSPRLTRVVVIGLNLDKDLLARGLETCVDYEGDVDVDDDEDSSR